MLAQDQQGFLCADCFGTHDLVGLCIFEHAILMDARFVSEGVSTNDGLVGLHDHAGTAGNQAARSGQLGRIDTGVQTKNRSPGGQGHGHFFERSVARALADAVDGDLGLSRACLDPRQAVGCRESQIVVAMHRDDAVIHTDDVLFDARYQLTKLARQGVADSVGDVECGGAGLDDGGENLVQKLRLGSPGIFWAKLDVVAHAARQGHHLDGPLEHLLARHAQLVLSMHGRGR